MYECRGAGLQRFLLAPVAGFNHVWLSSLTVTLFFVGGWFRLAAPLWFSWLVWRASRLVLHADATGLTVVNLARSHAIRWQDVRGVLVEHAFHDFPATLSVERAKGRLWAVAVHAVLGLSAAQRRRVALHIAELGRAYGYGFAAGDSRDIEALHRAGLINESDPAAHQAWWKAHDPGRPDQTS